MSQSIPSYVLSVMVCLMVCHDIESRPVSSLVDRRPTVRATLNRLALLTPPLKSVQSKGMNHHKTHNHLTKERGDLGFHHHERYAQEAALLKKRSQKMRCPRPSEGRKDEKNRVKPQIQIADITIRDRENQE